MKLYEVTPRSGRYKFVMGGTVTQIAEFFNSGVDDGYGLGKVDTDDLEENGGGWECPPDGWSESAPYYYDTPTDQVGGFSSLYDALQALVEQMEDCALVSGPDTTKTYVDAGVLCGEFIDDEDADIIKWTLFDRDSYRSQDKELWSRGTRYDIAKVKWRLEEAAHPLPTFAGPPGRDHNFNYDEWTVRLAHEMFWGHVQNTIQAVCGENFSSLEALKSEIRRANGNRI